MPTPDPSASLSPFQSWAVAAAGSGYDLAQLAVFAVVVGLAFVIFAASASAAAAGFRR